MIPGPGLHASPCYLFVTRSTHKAIDTCPKPSQKMIHRTLWVVYKQGLPMSYRVFGLEENSGKDEETTSANLSKDSKLEDEAYLTPPIGPSAIRRIFRVRKSLQFHGL